MRLRYTFAAVAICGLVLEGIYTVGLSDRKAAEKDLKEHGYKVVKYMGHTMLQGRPGGQLVIYTDKFKVIEQGHTDTTTVIATKSLAGTRGIICVAK